MLKTKYLKEGLSMEVSIDYHRKIDFSQKFLLVSDVHFDNPKCNRKKFFEHLNIAKQEGAGVLSFGDFFCMMQGKFDKRSSKSDIRQEHNSENYLQRVIEDSAEQLAPYAENLILLSDGNHETAILKRHEINPTRWLVEILKDKYNATNLLRGEYMGFVRFNFRREDNGGSRTKILFFHHGKWGGQVTKGVLSVNRLGSVVPDADIIVTGHTHDAWIVPNAVYTLNGAGNMKIKNQYHIKPGTYKEEFVKGGGWAVENIVLPKIVGGCWMTFGYDAVEKDVTIKFELTG